MDAIYVIYLGAVFIHLHVPVRLKNGRRCSPYIHITLCSSHILVRSMWEQHNLSIHVYAKSEDHFFTIPSRQVHFEKSTIMIFTKTKVTSITQDIHMYLTFHQDVPIFDKVKSCRETCFTYDDIATNCRTDFNFKSY